MALMIYNKEGWPSVTQDDEQPGPRRTTNMAANNSTCYKNKILIKYTLHLDQMSLSISRWG